MSETFERLICVAPNGARLGKADHAALPIEKSEIVTTARDCFAAGAAMIHLHVRDDQDRHVLDAPRYLDATAALRAHVDPDLVVQITTEAVGLYNSDEQMKVVRDVVPEAVSLALKELIPSDDHEGAFGDFWTWMVQENIWPQVILYNAEDVTRFRKLRQKGIFGTGPVSLLFVLGRYGKMIAQPIEVVDFITALGDEPDIDWSVCAFGPNETACVTAAALLGGHVRVGFENNRLLPNGDKAPNNTSLVEVTAESIQRLGGQLMSGASLRKRQRM